MADIAKHDEPTMLNSSEQLPASANHALAWQKANRPSSGSTSMHYDWKQAMDVGLSHSMVKRK